MHESWRRDYVEQIAAERAEAARRSRPSVDPVEHDRAERRGVGRARWLGVQMRSLVALVAVVEEGSFVKAARRLGYSRSTISHQIAQLESAIGVALVERGSGFRSVTVTPEGGVVVAYARVMLKLAESADARIAGLGSAASQGSMPRRLLDSFGVLDSSS